MNRFVSVRDKQDGIIKGKIKKILKFCKDNQAALIRDITAIIALNNSDILDYAAILDIYNAIYKRLNKLTEFEQKAVEDALIDAYAAAYKETSKLCDIAIDYTLLNPQFVKTAIEMPINGQRFSQAIWKNTNELANRIYNDVLDCVRTGRRPDEIARKIKDDYGRTAYEAKRLVHTELAKTVTAAQKEIYRQAGVEYVLWTATLESNTCSKCGELDGQIFKLDDAPDLPVHPNCRCCLAPAPDKYIPKIRANNVTKKNIDYTTWKEWKG